MVFTKKAQLCLQTTNTFTMQKIIKIEPSFITSSTIPTCTFDPV